MIELNAVRKSYGKTQALRGIDVHVDRGEIVGLLGPNGAGKTTAMKILVGYVLPTSGTACVAGCDAATRRREVQEKIGYLPENAPLYLDMIVEDYLLFTAKMRGVSRGLVKSVSRVVESCSIGDVLTRPIGQLSKGYRQRVGLAAAILHDPKILILDEPTTGLDPNQIVEVRDLIRRLGQTKTVILSTHILPEVEATCDRAVILIDGLVRADGQLSDLMRSRHVVMVARPGDADGAALELERLGGVAAVARTTLADGYTSFRVTLEEDDGEGVELRVREQAAALAMSRDWRLRELRGDARSLEQVFRELTAGVPAVEAADGEGS